MRTLSEILPETAARLGIKRKLNASRVFCVWQTIVGIRLIENCWPERLSGQILWIGVTDPVWSQQLAGLKVKLIARINEELGTKAVRDVRFRVGVRKREAPIRTLEAPNLDEISLSEEETRLIETGLPPSLPDVLRQKMADFFVQNAKLRKLRVRQGWEPCPACQSLLQPGQIRCPFCD